MTDETQLLPEDEPEDLSTVLKILSFCIPIAGAVIYFMNKDNQPKKARSACIAALLGFGLGIVLNIIATVMRGRGYY